MQQLMEMKILINHLNAIKMRTIKTILFAVCYLIMGATSNAQAINSASVSLLNEAVELTPFNDFFPVNPGLELGVNFWRKDKKVFGHQFNTYLGFYHHKNVDNTFYLKAEYLFQTKIKGVIGVDLFSSVGYKHSFYPGDVYALSESTGEYEKATQSGISRFTGGIGLGVTYLNDSKIEPFVRYEVNIDLPHKFLGLYPHTIFKIGANYKFNRRK